MPIITGEEIGTGHVDNSEDQISVSTFDSQTLQAFQGIKTKLLNLLDSLEQTIKSDMATSQTNELVSTETLADFELSIDTENRFYVNLIKNLTTQLNETMVKFEVAWNDFEVCKAEYNTWEQTLFAAQASLKNATEYYQSKKQQFQDMIDLFTSIYNYYKQEIYSASDDYKQRADDYIADQTFDTSEDFTKRNADEYNTLSGSVQSKTYEEASGNSLSELKERELSASEEAENKDEILKRADSLREKIRSLTKLRS